MLDIKYENAHRFALPKCNKRGTFDREREKSETSKLSLVVLDKKLSAWREKDYQRDVKKNYQRDMTSQLRISRDLQMQI